MLGAGKRVFLGAAILSPGRGGIARVARNSARALIEDGRDVSMLSLLDPQPETIAGRSSITVKGNRMAYLARCHAAALTHDAFLYDFLGVARAHSRLPGLRRPYGIWMHGIEVWGDLSSARMRVLRAAQRVLVNSRYTLERFQALHGELPNARICLLSTEEDAAPAPNARSDGPPTVLIVGRTENGTFYKGHQQLIAAWPAIVAVVPDARLVIVGTGSALPQVQALVGASPVRANIDVRGFVPEAEMTAIWQAAHVFAMPSRGEGFGLVYIEAMRHGIPVIASLQDAGQEVNRHGETGYNVDLERPEELTERLLALLTSPALLRDMGAAAAERWRAHFRYSAFKQRFLDAVAG